MVSKDINELKLLKNNLLSICLCFCTQLILFSCQEAKHNAKPLKPNIIVILADDLGYNDLGCYGAKVDAIKTPNIDKLAHDGIRFTDWQSANSVCGPARGSLLTGRYPPRNGYVVVSHAFNEDQNNHLGLYQDQLTIPELLKPLGYSTAAIGKWHMGEHFDYLPLRHGFDQYYGHLSNFATSTKEVVYEDDSVKKDSILFEDIHQDITTRAKTFIRKATEKETPFFLYPSHYLVHGPWEPSKEFTTEEEWEARQKYGGGINQIVYPAMVRELDWHIGELLKEVEQLGIAENTIIFFTSDNGPWLTPIEEESAGSAWPLRGSKFNTFEAGHRVPGIVKYPGKIPMGHVSDEMVSSMDVFATIADVVDVNLDKGYKIDGKSIWPLLTGEMGAKSPHEVLFAYTGKNLQTVRKGRWKLHLPRSPKSVPFYSQKQWGRGTIDSLKKPMLFDLENDIEEQTDVAQNHREVVEELLSEADRIRADLGDWCVIGAGERNQNGFSFDIHKIPLRDKN